MNKERGSILVVTLGFILVFTLLGMSSLYLSTVQNEAAEKRLASSKAFWLAEAGLQKTLWEFKKNNCVGLFGEGTVTTCISCSSCGNGNKSLAATLSGYGDYDVVMDYLNSSITSMGSYPTARYLTPLSAKCNWPAIHCLRMQLLLKER